jgi:hypothetical protein
MICMRRRAASISGLARVLGGIVMLIGSGIHHAVSADWPGASPECWSRARIVHGVGDYETLWKRNVSVLKAEKQRLTGAALSPNSGYAFEARELKGEIVIRIDSEKSQQTIIRIKDAFLGGEVHWVNEKLIAGRAWWGHIAMTDFIFDVEAARFLWHESATESSIAMQQYREGCRQSGDCECAARQAE